MTNPITTVIALHDVRHLQATSYGTVGAMVLHINTSFGRAEIILYLKDQLLADQLTLAVNNAWELHLQSPPPAAETAAYAALHYVYNGGEQ